MSVNTKVNGQLVKSAGLYSVTAPIGMADIYSTEEKEVGLWIDNKPLYAKTINFGALPNNNQKAVAHNISNIDTIVNISGVASGSTNRFKLSYVDTNTLANGIGLYADTQNVTIRTGSDRSSYNAYVTIFYTKTTDTPWSGKFVPQGYGYVSSGDIYSLEERQVGVWTDGKPLYQKTVEINSLPSSTYTTVNYAHNIGNVDKIVEWKGYGRFASGSVTEIPAMQFSNTGATALASFYGQVDATNISIMVGTDRSAMTATFTIRYTKTTDVAGSGEYVPSGDKAVHYSTEEQVVGTWIDGSTIYEICATTDIPQTNLWSNAVLTNLNINILIDATLYSNYNTASVVIVKANDIQAMSGGFRVQGTSRSVDGVKLRYTKASS